MVGGALFVALIVPEVLDDAASIAWARVAVTLGAEALTFAEVD